MNIDQNSLIALAIVSSMTLIGLVALIRNTPASLKVNLGKDKSLILEGSKPLSIPEKTKIDCLPSKENSQLCDR
ncbi:MAG: hypothetical protein AAF378_24720 [Cyanobacteria bacterium P01_A01_bin.84]